MIDELWRDPITMSAVVGGEMAHVAFRIVRLHDLLDRVEVRAVADTVGIQTRDGLENALGTIGFTGVHGLPEEVAVRVLKRVAVINGRVPGFLAREPQYLAASRLRYLGGTTNHWTDACAPLDPIDFAGLTR